MVPNWYQNLEPFLVHISRTLLYFVFENAGPNGRHLWAGLMAAIMLSGVSVWARATSRQLAQLIAAAGRAALTNLLRVRRVRRLLISTRPRAWQSTRASNLRVCIPHVFWANAAAVVPHMLPYFIVSARAEVNPNSLARRLEAMPLAFARAAPTLLRVTSTCCDLGKTHTCLNSVCGANFAERIWQQAEHNAARCFCATKLCGHGAWPRRRRFCTRNEHHTRA